MGYASVWKVLDQMIADLRKKGAIIPDKIMNDLKSAKTLLSSTKTMENTSKPLEEIEAFLVNVEAYIILEGEKLLGKKYANEWLDKISKASRKTLDDEDESERFISGLPREQKWIRVKPSADLPLEEIETLTNELGLSIRNQKKGYLLVYGTDKHIKDFIKKMTTKHDPKTRK